MILKEFTKIKYDGTVMTDIFRPLNFYTDQFNFNYIFSDFTIKGDDRPEYLAYAIGDNPEMTWLYLLTNDIADPFWGWVVNETDVRSLSERRYNDADGTHHYISTVNGDIWYDIVENPVSSGNWYDVGDTGFSRIVTNGIMMPITNYEYELSINENNRRIHSLNSSRFLSYDKSMKQAIKENVDVNTK